MDFVADNCFDVAENLSRFRCKYQVKRFGSFDQDIRRCFRNTSSIARSRIAASNGDGRQVVVLRSIIGDSLNAEQ